MPLHKKSIVINFGQNYLQHGLTFQVNIFKLDGLVFSFVHFWSGINFKLMRKEIRKTSSDALALFFVRRSVRSQSCWTAGKYTTNFSSNIAQVIVAVILSSICIGWSTGSDHSQVVDEESVQEVDKYLYVAVPGIRDYLGYGGHGLLVFDMEKNFSFIKRIPLKGFHPDGTPANIKGIDVSIPLNTIYISTKYSLQCLNLATEELQWEVPFDGGCDRMSIAPDGLTMYMPSFEKHYWNVVDCHDGKIISQFDVFTRAHNTIYGPAGKRVYLGDIGTPFLNIASTETHTLESKVGPFKGGIRPFTINSAETRVYVCVNDVLGFEVGDLQTGEKLANVTVQGWDKGPVRRHSCPSHGIALTIDEREVWVCDAHNMRIHVFSAEPPYQQQTSIPLSDMPGWITMSLDGQYAFASSGEIINVKTRDIVTTLKDEFHNTVSSEKMVEVHLSDGKAVFAGDQFGIGRANLEVK